MVKNKMGVLELVHSSRQVPDKSSSEDEGLCSQWQEQEDEILKELVKRHGSKKWDLVAARLPGRSAPDCKERWHAQLHASMNKSSWTEEEDKKLLEARKECGNKWMEIAQRVPGRTDNAVKNRYQALKRRQAEEASAAAGPVPTTTAAAPGFLMGPPEPQQPRQKRKYTKRAVVNKEPLGVIAEEDLPIGPSTSGSGFSHADKKPCIRPDLSIQIPSTSSAAPVLPLAVGPPVIPEPLAYSFPGRMTPNMMSSEAIQQLFCSSMTDTPRESIDMEEVMGWLTAQTPTPSTHYPGTASGTANSSLASSSFPSASNTPARLTPSPGNMAGFKFTGPSPRQLMSSVHAAADDRRGFALGHSPANLMGPSLNVSELEDLVRLLSGSEGAEPPAFGGYADLPRRGDGLDSFQTMGSTHNFSFMGMESTRGPSFDHLSHGSLFTRPSFDDKIR